MPVIFIPGVGVVVSFGEGIAAVEACINPAIGAIVDKAIVDQFEGMKQRISRSSYPVFKKRWRVLRMLIGLQARLFIEQAFWELGTPWRNLVTGFEPVK